MKVELFLSWNDEVKIRSTKMLFWIQHRVFLEFGEKDVGDISFGFSGY